jgi:SAM-dependent methyltransferase
VAFAFVRPADASVLDGRPLLDLGTGDAQTRDALAPDGFVIGVDRTTALLRAGDVGAFAHRLPFTDAAFATVLAADLFHHLDDTHLQATLDEVVRVLRPNGVLVAWWYEHTPDTAPDAPRFSRPYDVVAQAARQAGLAVESLALTVAAPNSATVGLLGRV